MNKAQQVLGREEELIGLAAAARENAYAPYSRFKVGAAVLGASGRVYVGGNVENVSYGLSICAERVAISKAVGEGERVIVAVAVVVDGEPAMPCGACLQVIQEFAGEDPVVIIASNLEGAVVRSTILELMPHAFKSFSPPP